MANNNQGQGIQIALIIFVILTVIFAVSTFLYYKKWDDRDRQATAAQEEATKATQARNQAMSTFAALKERLGFPDSTLESIDKDMAAHWAAVTTDLQQLHTRLDTIRKQIDTDENARSLANTKAYADYVTQVYGSLNDLANAQNTKLRIDLMERLLGNQLGLNQVVTNDDLRLRGQVVALQGVTAGEVGQYKREASDMREEKEKLAADLQAQHERLTRLVDEKVTANTKLQAMVEQVRREKSDLANRDQAIIRNMRALARSRGQKIQEMQGTGITGRPQGQIVTVDAANDLVSINLGEAAGLPLATTFSVYPATAVGNPNARPKAKIQVTKILGADQAQARITHLESISDPIVPGDQVYTPLWTPGEAKHFALAGILDLNNDDVDDRADVRRLIERAGGKIDADLNPNTKNPQPTGQITPDTTYFVVGKEPATFSKAYTEALSAMRRQARDYGVQEISLRKFIDMIGYTPRQRVLQGNQSAGRLSPAGY